MGDVNFTEKLHCAAMHVIGDSNLYQLCGSHYLISPHNLYLSRGNCMRSSQTTIQNNYGDCAISRVSCDYRKDNRRLATILRAACGN